MVKDSQSIPLYFISHVQDISERVKAENALKASESRATALLEAIPDIMFRIDHQGVFLDYQAEKTNLYAQAENTIIGKRNRDISPPEFADLIDEKIEQTLASEEMQTFEYQLDIPKRGLLYYEARMVKSGENEVIAIVRNVTEKRRAEQERLKANKLESLGVLAGGIAHDFNNLLTGLYGNIELSKMFLSAEYKSYRFLENAERSMESATHLTNQLLTFARGGNPVKETLALGDVIRETAEFSLRGSGIKLQTDIHPDLWLVDADKGQLSQVIGNLVINAQQAMPTGGTITITAVNKQTPIGNQVKISVQDEGTGIPPQYLDKIFDPYFSTKQKGSGLGLASSYSIISKHNGRIQVDSALNQGTTFTIQLPTTEKTIVENPVDTIDNESVTTARILVLDDEEMVRETMRSMLETMRHHVEFAIDGEMAIAKYQTANEANHAYDLVITDLTIPGGMGGQETAQEILKINPQAKLIVSSGYATDPVMADHETYGFRGIVAKPYRFSELKKVIQDVLEWGITERG